MCKYFTAGDEFAVRATQDMDPLHPGARVAPGLEKAFVTVYEPQDYAHPSLPTLREFLAEHADPETGLVGYDVPHMGSRLRLTIDPAPLRELPPEYLDYRVSIGAQFVTFEAVRRTRT